jgi:hypothetical protein
MCASEASGLIKKPTEQQTMKNILAPQFLALLFTFSATGCNFFSDTVSTNDRASIEVALQRLESQSDQWQTILEDLQKQVGLTVQNDIQNLLKRAIDSTAEQANCLTDIRIQQIKMSLNNLMGKLAGKPEKAATPIFCDLTPDNIRMDFVGRPGYEHVIKISGYDMDSGVISTKLHYRVVPEKFIFKRTLNPLRRTWAIWR